MSELKKEDLDQFTGSETFFRHNLVRRITYTEGVQFVAEKGGAYWLLDKIATNQLDALIASEGFQVWKLAVDLKNATAVLTCEDGDDREVFREFIDITDFPLDEIKFYLTNGVIMLPGEY